MNYAVDYADVGYTRIVRWEDSEEPTVIVLETDADELKFLQKINQDDKLWLELGGTGNVFAELAMRIGASVYRIPPFLLKDARDTKHTEKEQDSLILAGLAREKPEIFYPLREVDKPVVRLRNRVSGRLAVQKLRIATQLRLNRIYRDLWLIEHAAEILDLSLEDINTAIDAYLKEQLTNSPIFKGTTDEEKNLDKEIAAILNDMPLYKAVFEPVTGCSHSVAGTVIARIVDIRRFNSLAALTAYAGYHVNLDGTVPNRLWAAINDERAPGDKPLRQAVWLFTFATNYMKPENSEWKRMYVERKARDRGNHPEPVFVGYSCFSEGINYSVEEAKELKYACAKCGRRLKKKTLYTDGHIHNRALRWLGQKFIKHIWREWRRFEGLSVKTG